MDNEEDIPVSPAPPINSSVSNSLHPKATLRVYARRHGQRRISRRLREVACQPYSGRAQIPVSRDPRYDQLDLETNELWPLLKVFIDVRVRAARALLSTSLSGEAGKKNQWVFADFSGLSLPTSPSLTTGLRQDRRLHLYLRSP
ncbi:uncharacterized protein BDZ99DRAFT_196348 [Mytilinidion resinicola]|uniref:Uncharacterized protein n=1 Tax=Mytilinidion resinicola TaxID=574789 RepID=A0A6A6Z3Q8_9PEZI|nr:uncharacterized protein BDZ99DRAFT_196348 [Mytilinidion resinicola]KAF2815448.1 hypothetical protein BDZ99DRAFT_196348 [Mytilinidion resinicola]